MQNTVVLNETQNVIDKEIPLLKTFYDSLKYKFDQRYGIQNINNFLKSNADRNQENDLRQRIIDRIISQGFTIDENNNIIPPDMNNKLDLRAYHSDARKDKYQKNIKFIKEKEKDILKYFANGTEIEIESFSPKIQAIEYNTEEYDIFKYATLLWSVPVSNGFGRRVKFLIWDESNHKVVGLFALGDPVFNLRCRDSLVGWDHHQRCKKLYNVMDIFILGAVPPYNLLLGGKLTALAAASNEVREIIKTKYKDKKTIIQKQIKDPSLVLLTTGSALGKSSLYDRIRYEERTVYQKIGESLGYGHFHLNNGLYKDMVEYLKTKDYRVAVAYKFGQGPNWKIRAAKTSLKYLGFSDDLLKHGIKREIYSVPLAKNYLEFLNGHSNKPIFFDMPFEKLADYWYQRWFINRAKTKAEYKEFRREKISILVHSARNDGGL